MAQISIEKVIECRDKEADHVRTRPQHASGFIAGEATFFVSFTEEAAQTPVCHLADGGGTGWYRGKRRPEPVE